MNIWSDSEADNIVDAYAAGDINEDLALRVYTSRLLGRDRRLVLHGGGNTSVKTECNDFMGDSQPVLCVKGSGWDLVTIEPEGLPAVRLRPLQRVRERAAMSDEDMIRFLRSNLLDPGAPNPSVETLLHAFLPHKFVDHAHAVAVLAVSDQPDGMALCREIYGEQMAIVPYVMPGFELAKVVAAVVDAEPDVHGVILHKHGIFTFGDTAKQSYDRMIDAVQKAEHYLDAHGSETPLAIELPAEIPDVATIAPIVRGACSAALEDGSFRRQISHFRSSDAIRRFVDGADLPSYSTRGVVTPDHNIRIKNKPIVFAAPDANKLNEFSLQARTAADGYRKDYIRYFMENNARQATPKICLDTMPRVALVPGCGLFGFGKSAKEAAISADLAEIAIETILAAESIGRFEALGEAELFDMEYWSLEQAKLGKAREAPLARQIAVVSGGGGTIGAEIATLFAENGAEVAVLDRDAAAATRTAESAGGSTIAIACDVTDPNDVRTAFDCVAGAFGGVDILVSNAGAAWQGAIGEISDRELRQSFELNFFAHQTLAQNAVRIMRMQGTGGNLLFNASKQAIDPGRNFGAYGLPKAATLFLARQYALEYGDAGIRSNAVNADRIRSGLLTDEMVDARAKARGVSSNDYLAGNLLGIEVTAADVARAFLQLALATKTTGSVVSVDGGNPSAALR